MTKKTKGERLKTKGGKLDELAVAKVALDEALATYEADPLAGSSWPEVLARIRAKMRA